MSIKQTIHKYAKDKWLTDDILSLIENLRSELAHVDDDLKLYKKSILLLEELIAISHKLNRTSDPSNDVNELNENLFFNKICLGITESRSNQRALRLDIAWHVGMAMESNNIVPTATKNGQYENLVEEVLKAVGIEKIGGVHRTACSALKGFKSMGPRAICGPPKEQLPTTRRALTARVPFDPEGPGGFMKMYWFQQSVLENPEFGTEDTESSI